MKNKRLRISRTSGIIRASLGVLILAVSVAVACHYLLPSTEDTTIAADCIANPSACSGGAFSTTDVVVTGTSTGGATKEFKITRLFGPVTGGQRLRISGQDFSLTTNNTITIGGARCSNQDNYWDYILCDTPAGSVGSAEIVITMSGTAYVISNKYTYVDTCTSANLSTTSALYFGGDTVTVTVACTNGMTLNDLDVRDISVALGGSVARATAITSGTTFTFILPSHPSPEVVDVGIHLDSQVITLANGFEYTDSTIELTSDSDSVAIDAVADQATSGFADTTITTNSPTGYTLTASTNDTRLVGDTNPTDNHIPSITSAGSLCTTGSCWGFNIGSTIPEEWLPLPGSAGSTIKTTQTANTTGDTTRMHFSVFTDYTVASDDYAQDIHLSASINDPGSPPTPPEPEYRSQIRSSFFAAATNRYITQEEMHVYFAQLHELGISNVLLQYTTEYYTNTESATPGDYILYLYPTASSSGYFVNDVVGKALASAKLWGMTVTLGTQIADDEWFIFANCEDSNPDNCNPGAAHFPTSSAWLSHHANFSISTISELYSMYSEQYADQIEGFYLTFEFNNNRSKLPSSPTGSTPGSLYIEKYAKVVSEFITSLSPDLGIQVSPLIYTNYGTGPSGQATADFEEYLVSLFSETDINIFAPQDGVGWGSAEVNDLYPWYEAAKNARDAASSDAIIGANIENYSMRGVDNRDIKSVFASIDLLSDLVDDYNGLPYFTSFSLRTLTWLDPIAKSQHAPFYRLLQTRNYTGQTDFIATISQPSITVADTGQTDIAFNVAVGSDTDYYGVSRQIGSGPEQFIGFFYASHTAWTDWSLEPNTSYRYSFTSYDAYGNASPSATSMLITTLTSPSSDFANQTISTNEVPNASSINVTNFTGGVLSGAVLGDNILYPYSGSTTQDWYSFIYDEVYIHGRPNPYVTDQTNNNSLNLTIEVTWATPQTLLQASSRWIKDNRAANAIPAAITFEYWDGSAWQNLGTVTKRHDDYADNTLVDYRLTFPSAVNTTKIRARITPQGWQANYYTDEFQVFTGTSSVSQVAQNFSQITTNGGGVNPNIVGPLSLLIDNSPGSTNWGSSPNSWLRIASLANYDINYYMLPFEVDMTSATPQSIDEVGIRFLQDRHAAIWLPKRVEVLASTDGINFTHIDTIKKPNLDFSQNGVIPWTYRKVLPATMHNVVKIRLRVYPEYIYAWTFIGEVQLFHE